MSIRLVSLNVGMPAQAEYQGQPVASGIYKQPVAGEILLSKLNFTGDRQADLVNHGGPDKAVNLYPHEHYPYWEEQLRRKLAPAAFGENLTVEGMLETEVRIGDVLQIGTAVIQITQPRIPCYKLAMKWGEDTLPAAVIATGYSGYYARVLEEGTAGPDSSLEWVERDPRGVTIAEVNRIRHHEQTNRAALKRIASVPALAHNARAWFLKRLHTETEHA